MILYLTKDEILEIHDYAIIKYGGLSGIRDNNLLESAVETPKMTCFSEELYKSLELKASTYLYNIVKNHVFNDGNKRTGLASMLYFLKINGYDFKKLPSIQKLEDLTVNTADQKITLEEITFFIKIM